MVRDFFVRQYYSLMLSSKSTLRRGGLYMNNIDEMRKQLSFTNDFIFCTVMEENPDLCKQLVEKITGRPVKKWAANVHGKESSCRR